MLISTWNVNSVRARLENIKKYIKNNSPDLLLLQEIKTEEKNYPFESFKELGYNSYVSGQKSYNGVAILSKKKLKNIISNLPGDKIKQSRIITSEIKVKNKVIDLVNIYVPNGNPVDTDKYFYKINWLNLLIKFLKNKIDKGNQIIVAGDFNILPEDIDVYDHTKYTNDALFRIEIRKKYREIINLGLIDVFRHFNKKEGNYTFWDYTQGSWQKDNGLRIDHMIISNSLIEYVKKIEIKKKIRSQIKPSDHVPLECTFA
jgi:exodeoxyribonuclease-3